MENGVSSLSVVASTSKNNNNNSDTQSEKMGATNTNNAARKLILDERKKQIEEKLSKCNQELRTLCIQEAELTGITPPEMPLEIGETPPTIRRKVGTAFQLNESLLNNINTNKDQLIAALELEIQLHKNLRDAALGLASEGNLSKTVKRQHRAEYQKLKEHIKTLEEKLVLLKEKAASDLINKQKKKTCLSECQGDETVSVTSSESYNNINKLDNNRHSQISSSKHNSSGNISMLSPTDTYPELSRFPSGSIIRQSHQYNRNTESSHIHAKPEEMLTLGFYRLSLNGYNEYVESQETVSNIPHYNYPNQNYLFTYPHSSHSQPMHINSSAQQHHSPSSISQNSSHHQYLPNFPQQQQQHQQHSPLLLTQQQQQHSSQTAQQQSPQHLSPSSASLPQYRQNFARFGSHQYVPVRQTNNNNAVYYSSSHNGHGGGEHPIRHHHHQHHHHHLAETNNNYRNTVDAASFAHHATHSIQPHQQYENNGMNTGLGGCWRQAENGQMYWVYASSTLDNGWQRDKRFGSLDRRKNKRIQRKVSPSIDNNNKSATLAAVPMTSITTTVNNNNNNNNDQNKPNFVKPTQISSSSSSSGSRRTHHQDHNRQLVRTQSLGSVGQNIDSVYPSDDTSSCESDSRSFKDIRSIRKQKEKEWLETSLDGPIISSPTHSNTSNSHSTIANSEEKFILRTPPPPPLPISSSSSQHTSPQHHHHQIYHKKPLPSPPVQVQSSLSPKIPLEIPAESNPSPRIVSEPPNLELLNIVKPYHEETKPFEMSDFYKYSTKFKKSPQKEPMMMMKSPIIQSSLTGGAGNISCQQNLNENFENSAQENRYPPSLRMPKQFLQQREITTTTTANNNNTTNPLDQTLQLNVGERFSEEMVNWYREQEHNQDNNNNNGRGSNKGQSSATLV